MTQHTEQSEREELIRKLNSIAAQQARCPYPIFGSVEVMRQAAALLAATPAAGGGEAVEFNHYKVVVDALSDLLGQVKQFCVEQGEADFETGKALRAMESVCEYERTHPQPQPEAVRVPDGYVLVPVEPTPEMIAAAAVAVLPNPTAEDFELARKAARIVLAHPNSPPTADFEFTAAAMATIIPAHRAMLSAAPKQVPGA